MQRYFINQIDIENKKALLEGNDFHHIKNVMRSKKNDHIIVCDLLGNCFLSEIDNILDKVIIANLLESIPSMELDVTIDLAQGLIRKERFEYVLQKATELGVSNITPVYSKHSIIQLDSKKTHKKVERWNKITKEASEQSHRNKCVTVSDVKNSFKELDYSKYDVVLVAYEKENESKNFKNIFSQKYKNILLVVGPEGGLHESEIAYFESLNNVQFIGLGKRILRSETASSYMLSVIGYQYEIGDLS